MPRGFLLNFFKELVVQSASVHSPRRGQCIPPAPGQPPDVAGRSPLKPRKRIPLPPLKPRKRTPSPPKPRKRKNSQGLLSEIGELGGSGWRGSIRLVKLVWLVLPKKLVMGQKAQYTQKGQKTLKTGIFHTHPCGFYIKNRPFPIHSMGGP